MKPAAPFADGGMVKVDQFTQRVPNDGMPASQRTEVYLGYDDKFFYAAMIAFDSDPSKIRARMSRREDIFSDDVLLVILDTFNDKRRAYGFMVNPYGIQADGVWTEGRGWDFSWDTIWDSNGRRTDQGYVVVMAVPFRSMRFADADVQHWGIMLDRDIPGRSEQAFWPRYSQQIEGRLNQEGSMYGVEKVSPGRNMQFNPYVSMRSYRETDLRDATAPRFDSKPFKGEIGLDSKIVLKDSLVLDTTLNPDFAQVESDEPQVTANRRFEVFYPERRPFFIENSGFFSTPINLVFTRRIADPTYGVRLSGKTGPYSLGILFADDRSPGLALPENDPATDSKAYFGVVRINRDVLKQSTVGVLFTDREYGDSFNRVGGADYRLKFDDHWTSSAQAVVSSTRYTDGTYSGGPSVTANLQRSGRKFSSGTSFNDTGSGFYTESGFYRRPDYRTVNHWSQLEWHPKDSILQSHGIFGSINRQWDHEGTQLWEGQSLSYNLNFRGNTSTEFGTTSGAEVLRPTDFAAITANQRYPDQSYYLFVGSDYFQSVGFRFNISQGQTANYSGVGVNDAPPVGEAPRLARQNNANISVTLRPAERIRVDNSYTWERLVDDLSDESVYNTHIIRSKMNVQLSRAMSFRLIGTYNSLLTNPLQTTLQPTKAVNADFLFTYLVHPGTAVYVGYNSNQANLTPDLALDTNGELVRTRDRFINDSRQFFVKVSYLLRF